MCRAVTLTQQSLLCFKRQDILLQSLLAEHSHACHQSSRPVASLVAHADGAELPPVLLEMVVLDAVDPHFWTALANRKLKEGFQQQQYRGHHVVACCAHLVLKFVAKMANTTPCQSFPCCLLCACKEHLEHTVNIFSFALQQIQFSACVHPMLRCTQSQLV